MLAHGISAGNTADVSSGSAPTNKAAQANKGASGNRSGEFYLSSEQLTQDAKLFSMLLTI